MREMDNVSADLVEGFLFSLSLTAKIMVRTITEGRTLVMLAINAKSSKQLLKALTSAPRRLRTTWLLQVQVGTQKISPLYWAIDNGYLDVADTILRDILSIRADRDRYYYGLDELFDIHPDAVKRLATDASSLLPTLLDGLTWRAKTTVNGMRRVNYYVAPLLVDADGKFKDTLKVIAQ